MTIKKITILILITVFCFSNVIADNHDTEQNILEKAKEINKKIKKQQAEKNANISSEVGNAEPLPLNDPFVGDASLGGASAVSVVVTTIAFFVVVVDSDLSSSSTKRIPGVVIVPAPAASSVV